KLDRDAALNGPVLERPADLGSGEQRTGPVVHYVVPKRRCCCCIPGADRRDALSTDCPVRALACRATGRAALLASTMQLSRSGVTAMRCSATCRPLAACPPVLDAP